MFNLIWGYNGQWLERQYNTNCIAGTNNLDFTEVPEGEVWVLKRIVVTNINTNCSRIRIYTLSGGTVYTLEERTAPTKDVRYGATLEAVLVEGDQLEVGFEGCAAGDDIYAWVNGYKMVIAQ
jgi:hypothetical protein